MSLDHLLGRLIHQPILLCLDAGPQGCVHLAWRGELRPLRSLADLPGPAAGCDGSPTSDGWPSAIASGWFVQLDYAFPVGANADRLLADGAIRGWAFRPEAWLRLDTDGHGSIQAANAGSQAQAWADLAGADLAIAPACLATPLAGAWDEAGHVARVDAIRAAIAAGEIYQANLTMPFRAVLAPGSGRDLAAFLALRRRAPAAFACLFRRPGLSVVSHSPECFLASRDGICVSRPIKGTRPRRPGQEAETRQALLSSAKDRAELAMIVDLVRNDLGRVALPGGVRVATPMRVVDLPYVHHLVAEVEARLRPGTTHADLLAAAFPAGSITGAPKIQAMRVIRRLEAGDRGPYCGTFGWLGSGSDACLAVAIRTLVISGDEVRLDAGGGIVADSDGAAEWRELMAKAGPMAAALGGHL